MNTNPFPRNPAIYLMIAELCDMVELNMDTGLFAETCRGSIRSNPAETIRMMHDQIKDNEPLMLDQFGMKVINKVKQIVHA